MTMTLTDEMKEAFRMIEETTENLFITGKAGTGKTTFLKYLVENTHKSLIVAASTGIAAINAGGVTLHSLFNIPLDVLSPTAPIKGRFYRDKARMMNRIDTLVIDEVSMVRPDTLDYIDRKLKLYRMNDLPFGGVQLVFFGDLFQLPPVIKKEEAEILANWYNGFYFFHSRALRKAGMRVVELTHVFRQKDERFINILNRIREYQLLPIDIDELTQLRDNRKSRDFNSNAIHICSLRKDADKFNQRMMGEATHTFDATFNGNFNPRSAPCESQLKLREGARVMTLVNDTKQGFYNGSMGTVSWIEDGKVGVKMDNGKDVVIEPYTWKDREYVLKDNEIETVEKGSCTQLPLTLGWAITIHKSQGLTFDNIVIHCPYTFAPGMMYVALSRCTSMEGIVTNFFISEKSIKQNKELLAFNMAYKKNGNIYNTEVHRALCRYMGYDFD